jgi:hypothetical protein
MLMLVGGGSCGRGEQGRDVFLGVERVHGALDMRPGPH